MKRNAIYELITAAKSLSFPDSIGDGRIARLHKLALEAEAEIMPSPYTHFLAGAHRVEVDPVRLTITVDGLAYSVAILAGDLVTAPGTWLQIERNAQGGLNIRRAEESVLTGKATGLDAGVIGKLVEALEGLIDDEPCWYDHHGCCQEHFVSSPCEMAEARATLALAKAAKSKEATR